MDDSNKVKHRRKHLLRYHNLGAFTSPMWQTAKLVSRTYLSPVTSIFLFMHNYSQLHFKNQKQTSLSLHSVSQLPCSLMENERAKSDSLAMYPEITYLVHMYPEITMFCKTNREPSSGSDDVSIITLGRDRRKMRGFGLCESDQP